MQVVGPAAEILDQAAHRILVRRVELVQLVLPWDKVVVAAVKAQPEALVAQVVAREAGPAEWLGALAAMRRAEAMLVVAAAAVEPLVSAELPFLALTRPARPGGLAETGMARGTVAVAAVAVSARL